MKNTIVVTGLMQLLFLVVIMFPDPTYASRRPLDLPRGGMATQSSEHTNEVIHFYGQDYESDAFFFCLDRSSSMRGEKIQILKQEMRAALDQLSSHSEFGIVTFSHEVEFLHTRPLAGTNANKAIAEQFVNRIRVSGGTDLALGMSYVLRLSNRSTKHDRHVILLGDGMPNSVAEALVAIAQGNSRNTPISTIYVANDSAGLKLFRDIAETYDGSFRWAAL